MLVLQRCRGLDQPDNAVNIGFVAQGGGGNMAELTPEEERVDLLDREASPGHFASADILHATEQLNQWVVDNKVAHKGTAGIVIGAVCLHVCSLMLHRECRPCCHCVVAVAELLPRLRRRPASPHRAALYGRLDSSKGPHGRRVHQDTAVPSQYVTYRRLLPCGHLSVVGSMAGNTTVADMRERLFQAFKRRVGHYPVPPSEFGWFVFKARRRPQSCNCDRWD